MEVRKNKSFVRDISWYMVGTMIPMLLNLFKTPIFTRHYSTEDFGYLGLVLTTFTYLSTVSFAWLASCMWRYYNDFKKRIGIEKLYSNILFLYLLSALLTLIITLIMVVVFYQKEMNFLVLKLVLLAFMHFCVKGLLAIYMVVIRIKGSVKLYNFILISQASFAFALLLLFAFDFDMDISAMISSSLVIDFFIILILFISIIKRDSLRGISPKHLSKRIMKILFGYGSLTLITSLFLMFIVSSDRYIIAMYDTISNVGIYTKVYDIAQLSLMAIILVYFNTINPRMIKELTFNFQEVDNFMVKYIYAFLFFGIPIVFFTSIYAKEIVQILLGEDFRSGYVIMPCIFFSLLLYGIILFCSNKLKFSNKLIFNARIYGIAFIFNLILNFLFVPKFGYMAAAYSTLFSYIFILVCFLWNDSMTLFKRKNYLKDILGIFVLMSIFWLIDFELRKLINFKLEYAILEGLIFAGIFTMMYFRKIKNMDLPID